MLGVNMTGTLMALVEGLPYVLTRRGRIVVAGSVMGFWPMSGWTLYVAFKAMLVGLVRCLDLELRLDNVTVTHLILPYLDTDFRKRNEKGEYDRSLPDWAPKWMVMAVETAARIAADGVWNRDREVHFTFYGRIAIWIDRFFPWAVPG